MRPIIATAVVLAVVAAAVWTAFLLPSLIAAAQYSGRAGGENVTASNIYAISVSDPVGYVYVGTWNGSTIQVTYSLQYFPVDPLVPVIRAGNGTLGVEIRQVIPYLPGYYEADVRVLVPYSMAPHVSVSSTDGDVSVELPAAETVGIGTTNGNIDVKVIRASEIDVATTNGNIGLIASDVGNAQASTVNGRIYADLNGPLHGNYVFTDVNGGIEVLVPRNASVAFYVSSSNGAFGVSGIPITPIENTGNSIQGIAGNGTAYLRESTVNGEALLEGQ